MAPNSLRKNLWAILVLALPILMENVFQSMVGLVDTFFVSKLGLASVAAVGVTNSILQLYFGVFLAVATASSVFVAHAIGAGDGGKAQRIVIQAVILACIAGAILGLITFIFARPFLELMGASPEVLADGVTYFRIVATPAPLIALMFTLGSVLRGAGDTRTPMKVGLTVNLVHIVLDYLFIFGLHGIPGAGIAGAAWATVLARLIGVALLYRQIWRHQKLSIKDCSWRWNSTLLWGITQLAYPAALERLFMRFGQIIYFGMIIRMGTEVYAAHQLAGNFTIFASIVGTALGGATTILVGQSLGTGDLSTARSYSKYTAFLAGIIQTVITAALFLLSPLLSQAFTQNAAVIGLITIALGIDLIAQPAQAAVTVLTATLQAGGDTKFPMYATALGIWAVRTAGVYLFGVHLGFGLAGVWASIALDNYLRASFLLTRYRSGKWIRSLQVG